MRNGNNNRSYLHGFMLITFVTKCGRALQKRYSIYFYGAVLHTFLILLSFDLMSALVISYLIFFIFYPAFYYSNTVCIET